MTTGAKYFVQLPTMGEPSIINYGPFPTLPRARDAASKLKERWSRLEHVTPPGMPSVMLVKVIEESYVGAVNGP
jgi:hypothetical protein